MSFSSGAAAPLALTPYQKWVVGLLAVLQFTIILDFMILSPLGPILMPELAITPRQFGLVVSVYAFSAGISGILAAGFADKFDRKRLLLVFYAGFLFGTFLCGIAPNYPFLMAARVVTGLFGGVIGSISFAIVADLFPLAVRGRVMGTIQSAFAASMVMGIPIGLFLASRFGWHGPFRMIVAFGAVVGLVLAWKLQPITAHMEVIREGHPLMHLLKTATNRRYLVGFTATMLVATGGFMLQPFASNFAVHNLGVSLKHLPVMYMASGAVGMVAGPLLGNLADRFGKFRLLTLATLSGMAMVWWWTGLDRIPFWLAIAGNCLLFATISGRQVATMALISAVPEARDRGAYMSVSASMQQFAGAVSSSVSGLLVIQSGSGRIENYHLLGWVVIAAMALTLAQMWNVDRMVRGASAARG
ncbi:MFS transporter [Geothrix sp. PMB-07]|uniref:MFS transporter n=1 Tax=Geothrix sp. PMB-07 TaxID=3068640 RepID=UPI002741417E|nr:MFS transporter [Geothrix sp. PMB-07]WLT30494.1 MFS transporter [Geothrix sp. PMB-07]